MRDSNSITILSHIIYEVEVAYEMTPFGLVFMCLGLVARGLALQNLVETLKANNATTLVSLIDQAGLTNTLAMGGERRDF